MLPQTGGSTSQKTDIQSFFFVGKKIFVKRKDLKEWLEK